MKDLEDEKAKLKRMVANLTLGKDAIKTVLEKSTAACRQTGGRGIIGRRAAQCSPRLQHSKNLPFPHCLPSTK